METKKPYGQVAYEAMAVYVDATHPDQLVNGSLLKSWDLLNEEEQKYWNFLADAVVAEHEKFNYRGT